MKENVLESNKACEEYYYQLEKEVMRNPLEERDIFNNGEEETVCDA